jgi:glycerophosphoryl diester phosphodiesterase
MKSVLYTVALVFIVFSCNGEEQNGEYGLPAPRVTVSNPVPCLGEEVQFYYQSDVSGNPLWDFGDGATSTDALVKHVFPEEKQYGVTLTLTDGAGGKAVVHTSIEVMGKSLKSELWRLASRPSEIWLCAHRANTYGGIQAGIPENSVEAIQQAIAAGANMVEIDVQATLDGHFVLMHDATINRTTNASGNVKDKTLAQLKTYRLRAANGALTACTIPTLEEALLAGRGKIYFNLDKVSDVTNKRKLVILVNDLYMLDRTLFYVSGSRDSGSEIRNVNTESLVFPWISSVSGISSWTGSQIIQIDWQGTAAASIITAGREKGMISYSNSLNSAGDDAVLKGDFSSIDKMKAMQLQVIQTDYTEKIRDYLK